MQNLSERLRMHRILLVLVIYCKMLYFFTCHKCSTLTISRNCLNLFRSFSLFPDQSNFFSCLMAWWTSARFSRDWQRLVAAVTLSLGSWALVSTSSYKVGSEKRGSKLVIVAVVVNMVKNITPGHCAGNLC